MAQHLQATLDTILEKVAILEGRFDKLLTQSLVQLSDTAGAKEGEINVEVRSYCACSLWSEMEKNPDKMAI